MEASRIVRSPNISSVDYSHLISNRRSIVSHSLVKSFASTLFSSSQRVVKMAALSSAVRSRVWASAISVVLRARKNVIIEFEASPSVTRLSSLRRRSSCIPRHVFLLVFVSL